MNGRAARLLIVDDDEADVEIMEIILRESGLSFTLDVCRDGEQASQFFANREPAAPLPDLILLDLNMPKKDGREFLRELKADPALMNLPVIVLTTSASPDDLAAFCSTRTTCLLKPFVLKEYGPILAAIRKTLEAQKS